MAADAKESIPFENSDHHNIESGQQAADHANH